MLVGIQVTFVIFAARNRLLPLERGWKEIHAYKVYKIWAGEGSVFALERTQQLAALFSGVFEMKSNCTVIC